MSSFNHNLKIAFFVFMPSLNPTARMRGYKIAGGLRQRGIEIDILAPCHNWLYNLTFRKSSFLSKLLLGITTVWMAAIRCWQCFYLFWRRKQYQAIIIQRELHLYLPPFWERFLEHLGLPILYDVDDAIYLDTGKSRPLKMLGYRGGRNQKFREICNLSAHLVLSTPVLKQAIEDLGFFKNQENMTVIPTGIEVQEYLTKSHTQQEVTVIGWIGTPVNYDNLRTLFPVLDKLARSHKILFKVISSGIPEGIRNYQFPFEVIEWSKDKELRELNLIDIGVMPLNDEPFNQGKGAFKIIQYWGCGIPVVASPVGINKEIVPSRGFLAKHESEWSMHLIKLIENPDLRNELGRAGRKLVEENFDITQLAAQWLRILKEEIETC